METTPSPTVSLQFPLEEPRRKRVFITRTGGEEDAAAESATGKKPATGYTVTLMHFIKGYIGTGIFAMGEAFHHSGILLGPILLTTIALMNLNCQYILIRAAMKIADQEEDEVKPSFAETVEYTMESSSINFFRRNSSRIAKMTNILLIITELGFCCVYFVFVSVHLLKVIPLRNEMRKMHLFTSPCGVLNCGMLIVTLLFGVVGGVSYYCYGDKIQPSVFENLPPGTLSEVTQGLISVAVAFTFTLHMYIPYEISYPLFHRKYGPFKHPFCVRFVYKSVPVLITFILAHAIPFLGLFIALVGSSSGAILTLILPPILDLIAFGNELNLISKIKDFIILITGVVGAITGTGLTIYQIVLEFQKQASERNQNKT